VSGKRVTLLRIKASLQRVVMLLKRARNVHRDEDCHVCRTSRRPTAGSEGSGVLREVSSSEPARVL
jgi:hypothetical protein